MELVYEARTSYSQSLDQGTIFIDLIKIPVSFQHLSSPRIPRILFFAKKLRVFLQHDVQIGSWCQKFGSHRIWFQEIAAELRYAAATIAFPDKAKLRLFEPFSIHDAGSPIPGELL